MDDLVSLQFSSPLRLAAAPFDDPDADIALCSSDGIKFLTHKAFLKYTSPVFSSMFSLPQPPCAAKERDGYPEGDLPSIDLTEDSETVERLLRWCYPIPDPTFRDVADTAKVLEAVKKYEMEFIGVRMAQVLRAFVARNPTAVYAVACRYGFWDLAYTAAVAAQNVQWFSSPRLRCPVDKGPNPRLDDVPELDYISAGALHHLLRFCYDREATFQSKPDIPKTSNGPDEFLDTLLLHTFKSPFQDSEIILETPDGSRFHAHSVLLKLSSPALAESIRRANTPPEGGVSTSCSVVPIDEVRSRLRLVLHFCYPSPDFIPSDAAALERALGPITDAARKYQVARLTDFARRMVHRMATTAPLRAYMIAVREGWEREARHAAQHAVYRWADAYMPEMEHAPARAYHRLLVYRCACLRAIVDLTSRACTFNGGTAPPVAGPKQWQKHRLSWHACSTYLASATQPEGGADLEYDTMQARWIMLSVIDGPSASPDGVLAPFAVARRYTGAQVEQTALFNEAVKEGNMRAAELRTHLTAIEF